MDIEEFIFNTYKDVPLTAKKFKSEIARKYNMTMDQARNIFVRINNYQIKTYGEKLDTHTELSPYSKEELYKIGRQAKQRKYDRRGRK